MKMNCKNCHAELNSEHKYCNECGAKIVNERITLKNLISGLLVSLGWDNRFFVTFKDLVLKPELVFEKYLNGTRKKYTNPFTFFAIGAALSVFIFNIYSDKLLEISTAAFIKPSETLIDVLPQDNSNTANNKNADYLEQQKSINKKIIDFQYNYYYYLSFLLLPLYALIAIIVFGKPENYGEHLVINAYIQGMLFFFGLFLFVLTLLIRFDIYNSGTIPLTIFYYCYTYKRYRKYTIGRTFKKLLKFFVVIIVIILIIMVVSFLLAIFNNMLQ